MCVWGWGSHGWSFALVVCSPGLHSVFAGMQSLIVLGVGAQLLRKLQQRLMLMLLLLLLLMIT